MRDFKEICRVVGDASNRTYTQKHHERSSRRFGKDFQLLYRLAIDRRPGLDTSCILVTPCGVR